MEYNLADKEGVPQEAPSGQMPTQTGAWQPHTRTFQNDRPFL